MGAHGLSEHWKSGIVSWVLAPKCWTFCFFFRAASPKTSLDQLKGEEQGYSVSGWKSGIVSWVLAPICWTFFFFFKQRYHETSLDHLNGQEQSKSMFV